jgi:hypothetical protein
MGGEERQVEASGEREIALRPAVTTACDPTKTGGRVLPLDPLIRVLDRAAVRSTLTGYGCRPSGH